MKSLHRMMVAVMGGLMSLSSPSQAQVCTTGWMAGPMSTATPGPNGPIHAMIEYSAGGGAIRLIVAGEFTHVGGIAANNIASWDGAVWQPLGAGCDGAVHALTIYNGSLIAGGAFLSPGRRIAAWNGSSWASMADIGEAVADPSIAVRAMAEFNGQLFVGGRFCCVNGTGVLENCARFDGGLWYSAPGIANVVRAMAVADFDGAGPALPRLYLGGERYDNGPWSGMFRYTEDGATWEDVVGPFGNVYALTFMPNGLGFGMPLLIVGGGFTDWVLPNGDHILARNIMRYAPGLVLSMGGGLEGGAVLSLHRVGSDLYVGGRFDTAGGLDSPGIARVSHAQNQWEAVLGGIDDGGGNGVMAIQAYNNFVYAGGEFVAADNNPGIVGVQNIARWNGIAFGSVGNKPRVSAVASLGSRLFAGGDFGHVTQDSPGSPPLNRYNILTWDGVNTGSLGQGANAHVRSLLAYTTGSGPSAANVVIAGGYFTTVYGDGLNPSAPIAANRVAQWTEPAFGLPSWSAMGAGFNSLVHTLTRFNGSIVAGGAFTASGGTTTNYVAKYVGSPPAWQPLTSPDPGLNGTVFAMKAFSDELGGTNTYLVMGGAFTAAPPTGVAANRILMRRESSVAGQSAYQALGAGFANGFVMAIERYGSGLNARTYAAGSFTMSGTTTVNRIAVLNGSNWQPVGNGIGFNNVVYALRSHGGYLYAAGLFTSVDGIAANRVARWNGSVWSAVDGGADDEVTALRSFGSELIAGGFFTSVKAPPLVSPALARLTQTGLFWIAKQPSAKTVDCGDSASFTVTVAPGYPNLAYAWRRDGVPLTDGPTPQGSIITGTATASITIANARPQDTAVYSCFITNPCASVLSVEAPLTIAGGCCPADINGDNQVNVTDLLAVIGAWGACVDPNNCPPDINNDDAVNVTDLLAVIGAWGACP